MGAASRSSIALGIDALAAVKRPSADLGDALLAAARSLASSRQLVSVLADVGVPAEQRSALVGRVFAGLPAQAQTVLQALASGRWSEPEDLVAGVEEVGIRALAASPKAERLDAELFEVQQAVASDGGLELALGASASPVAARLALVDAVLKDANPATRAIVRHVVELPRGRKPIEALREAQSIVSAARDRLVALVQSATPLTEPQAEALALRLETAYKRKIFMNRVLDASLLGGVRITIGDDVIDGTVRARLDDLRLRLVG